MFYLCYSQQNKLRKIIYKTVVSDSTSATALLGRKKVILCQFGNKYFQVYIQNKQGRTTV
jgi:hypothetical protein